MHDCFHRDYDLLRAAAVAADPGAGVPSCPDWTVTDLVRHVAQVYQHKALCIRDGAEPDPWPPERTGDPIVDLDEQCAELELQFGSHPPSAPAPTWGPDQTVGFWMRRMAQETVIHRVDAELAAGMAVSAIPDDLALDGIDEVLKLFLEYASVTWADDEDVIALMAGADQRPIAIRVSSGQSWTVTSGPKHFTVTDGEPAVAEAAAISGAPSELLLWLWNRTGDDAVTIAGDAALLAQFHAQRAEFT